MATRKKSKRELDAYYAQLRRDFYAQDFKVDGMTVSARNMDEAKEIAKDVKQCGWGGKGEYNVCRTGSVNLVSY